MKKVFFVLSPLLLAVGIFLGVTWYLNKTSGKGALQVTANPKSNVYLNGNLVGQTPLRRSEGSDALSEGDYAIKIAPLEAGFTPFEQKMHIASGILTVVDWTFGSGASSEGSIISLSPISDKQKAQILILSVPKDADVVLDSSPKGKTPLLLSDVTDSDHEVKLTKAGLVDKALRIHATLGYKLLATVFLGITNTMSTDISSFESTSSATPTPSIPESTTKLTPSPTKASKHAIGAQKVVILDTPNGFLRVRSEPTTAATEIARVKPGESYPFVSEQSGWYEITLPSGDTGWISGAYAQKE